MFNFKQIYVDIVAKKIKENGWKERYRAIVNHTGTDKREKNLSSEHNSKMNRRKLFSK